MNGNFCFDCGTECIDNCPRCGAPQCCPKCCAGDEIEVVNIEHIERIHIRHAKSVGARLNAHVFLDDRFGEYKYTITRSGPASGENDVSFIVAEAKT
ncbi:MAG: hypothetical protein ABUJ92_00750 [Desulfobacterales bacterium]